MIVNLLRKFVREEVLKVILVELFQRKKRNTLNEEVQQDPMVQNTTSRHHQKKRRQYAGDPERINRPRIESGMALNSFSKEFNNRRRGGKVVFKELTGDTTALLALRKKMN